MKSVFLKIALSAVACQSAWVAAEQGTINKFYAGGHLSYVMVSDDDYFAFVNDGSGFKNAFSVSVLAGLKFNSVLSVELEAVGPVNYKAGSKWAGSNEVLELKNTFLLVNLKQRFALPNNGEFWYIKESLGSAWVKQSYVDSSGELEASKDESLLTPGFVIGVEREYNQFSTPYNWYTEFRVNGYRLKNAEGDTHTLVFSGVGMGVRWLF